MPYNYQFKRRKKSDIIDIYRDYANEVNRRMRGIEKENAPKYAYSKMKSLIQSTYDNPRKRRYNTRKKDLMKYTKKQIESMILDMQFFLNAKTSTVEGAKRAYEKTIETFRKKPGMTMKSPEKFFDILQSASYRRLIKQKIPSEFIQEFIDNALENKVDDKEITEALRDYSKGNFDTLDELYEAVGIEYSGGIL